jgi:hypothetical protein
MNGRIFLSLILFMEVALASCGPLTRTTGASFTDPAYQGHVFNSFVVKVEGAKLAERQAIENALAVSLQQSGIPAQESMGTLPPTRDFSDGQIKSRIVKTGREALLVVVPHEKELEQYYTPGTYAPGTVYTYPVGRGRVAHVREPGIYEPGYYVSEPHAYYSASLYALPSFDKVWTADLETEGPGGMSFLVVGQHFADAAVKRLAQDGLIYLPPKK